MSQHHPPPPYIGHPTFEEILEAREAAQINGSGLRRCVHCHHIVFYFEADKGYVDGHVYSELGLKEFNISKVCETCFDKITTHLEDMEDTSLFFEDK